jgi:hypothetical protein
MKREGPLPIKKSKLPLAKKSKIDSQEVVVEENPYAKEFKAMSEVRSAKYVKYLRLMEKKPRPSSNIHKLKSRIDVLNKKRLEAKEHIPNYAQYEGGFEYFGEMSSAAGFEDPSKVAYSPKTSIVFGNWTPEKCGGGYLDIDGCGYFYNSCKKLIKPGDECWIKMCQLKGHCRCGTRQLFFCSEKCAYRKCESCGSIICESCEKMFQNADRCLYCPDRKETQKECTKECGCGSYSSSSNEEEEGKNKEKDVDRRKSEQ